jgi:predicted NAD/FAD-dependent oxidoreductase
MTTKVDSQSSSSSLHMTKKTTIAVIGGGIAGLSFAERLTKQMPSRFDVTVFDTGRVRPGGRCSSRQPYDRPKNNGDAAEAGREEHPILSTFRYDHAAQVITIDAGRFPEFAEQVRERWVPAGILRPFPPSSLFRIESATRRHDMQPLVKGSTESDQQHAAESSVPAYYYAPKGMGSLITDGMVANSGGLYNVRQDVWISPSNGAKYSYDNKDSSSSSSSSNGGPRWTLQAKGRVQGRFDDIVIAHNGKCADRLMGHTPAKQVHQLLRVKFDSAAPDVSNKMILNSLYSWTFCLSKSSSALSKALGDDSGTFMCGFVENCDDVKFLTCQTHKLDQVDCPESEKKYEVWTVLSSPQFAKLHKAPQESLGPEVVMNVTRMLGESLEAYFQLPPESLTSSVVDQRLQLWGAGLPLNTYRNSDDCGFVYDPEFGVGVCGDWLVDPSLAGAWTSGRRLADHLMSDSQPSPQGLGGNVVFDRCGAAAKAGIGSLQQGSPPSSKPVPASSPKQPPSTSASARSPSPRAASTLPSRRRARSRTASQ